MIIRALESFSGVLSLGKGQTMECNDEVILQDLLQAGYIEEVETPQKGVKKNESKRNTSK